MKKGFIRWHVLGWLLYFLYEIVGSVIQVKALRQDFVFLSLSVVLFHLIEFYICYLIIFPRLFRPGRVVALVAALLGVIAFYIGMRYSIEEVLYPAVLGFHNYTPSTSTAFYIYDNLYYASVPIGICGAIWAGKSSLLREQENQQLREEKRLAEMAFLKTQINPHFLYNTLNLLYGMAYPVSKPLASAILKLADLMRYMLHDGLNGQVELTEEIDYLQNFLALYRLRFPDQLFVEFTITGEPAGHRIAPLVLIPFVENALKHGVLDDPTAPVRIQLAIRSEGVTFNVDNRINDYQKDATSGIGLSNLRRRLALLYPGRYTLHIAADKDQFSTRLQLV